MTRFLGERGLDLAELDGPVRRVVLTAYAVLVGLALGVGVRDLFSHPVVVAQPGIAIPTVVAVVSAIAGGIGLAMAMAGAAHARSAWRYLIVLPGLAAVLVCDFAVPSQMSAKIPLAPSVALYLTPLLLLAGCVVVVVRAPRMRMAPVLIVMLVMVGAFAAAVMALTSAVSPSYGPTALFISLGFAGIVLAPALLVVGVDLAVIAADGVATLLKRLQPAGRPRTRIVRAGLILAAVLVGVGLQWGLGYGFRRVSLLLTLTWICGVLIAGAAFVWLRRGRPAAAGGDEPGLTYQQILLTAIALYLIGGIGGMFTEIDGQYYNYVGAHPFSLRLPDGLKQEGRVSPEDPRNDFAPVQVPFLSAGRRPPTVTIVGFVRPPFVPLSMQPTTINQLVGLRSFATMPLAEGAADSDGWRRGLGAMVNRKGHVFRFVVLEREVDTPMASTSINWFIVCGDRQENFEKTSRTCEDVRQSFLGANRSHSARGPAAALDALVFCLAGGALVLGMLRRRKGPTPVLDLVYWSLGLAGLCGLLGFAWGGIDSPFQSLKAAAQLLAALVIAAAIVSAGLEVTPPRRFKSYDLEAARGISAEALASLGAIGGFMMLYILAANSAEDSQAIRGVVICLALTWELATAGPTLNPVTAEHHVFPRSSRVLVFAAYLILVATCVLLFSGSPMMWTGERVGSWDTEGYVARGLVMLGAALVVSRATARLAMIAAPEPQGAGAETAVSPAPAATSDRLASIDTSMII